MDPNHPQSRFTHKESEFPSVPEMCVCVCVCGGGGGGGGGGSGECLYDWFVQVIQPLLATCKTNYRQDHTNMP
jgi:hypothetical protein